MPTPVTINARVTNCGVKSSRPATCCRSSSGCGSVGSARSEGSLPVPVCMKAVVRTSSCCNQPRPDCCRVPGCEPPLPRCPDGIFVKRTQPIRPDRKYEVPKPRFAGLSSYRDHYPAKCGNRSLAYKPVSAFDRSSAKMEGRSCYRAAYPPKPTVAYRKPSWAKKDQYKPSASKTETSTYKVDYAGGMGEKVRSMKPAADKSVKFSTAKMEGATTYKTTYIPFGPRELKNAKRSPTMTQGPPVFNCAPMEGQSTYRSDYWPKCGAKLKSMKPSQKVRFSKSKLADRTSYRSDYRPFHFARCVGKCIPSRLFDKKFPDDGLFACCGASEAEPPYEEPCPIGPGCCEGGMRGSCGNEMGLFRGPLPECCRPDAVPKYKEADC